MSDIADRAANEESAFINNALQVQRDKSAVTRVSRTHCIDCEVAIPAARQAAAPGCLRCLGCANFKEKQGQLL